MRTGHPNLDRVSQDYVATFPCDDRDPKYNEGGARLQAIYDGRYEYQGREDYEYREKHYSFLSASNLLKLKATICTLKFAENKSEINKIFLTNYIIHFGRHCITRFRPQYWKRKNDSVRLSKNLTVNIHDYVLKKHTRPFR